MNDRRCIGALTLAGFQPPYVSVNEKDEVYEIIVRGEHPAGAINAPCASIKLSRDDFRKFVSDLVMHL